MLNLEPKTDIQKLISKNQFELLNQELERVEPTEAAAMVVELSDSEQQVVFKAISSDIISKTFKHFPHQTQLDLIHSLEVDKEKMAEVLNKLTPDDRTAFFIELPEETREDYLSLLAPKELENAKQLLSYPEDSVGRLATTDYVAIRKSWTVEQALRHIRRFGRDSETINVIYIVDENWKLLDDIRLRELLLAEPEGSIESLMDHRFVALDASEDQENSIRIFREYDRAALPVIETDGTLIGIITSDDILDVVEEEATEDIQKLGGVEALDDSYIETPLSTLIKKRSRWLAVLFIGEMFTATAMGYFESEIAKAVVLALFVPLVISSGGNSGSQAATLIIRSLAVNEITLKDWWRVMRREMISGLVLGGILGLMGFLRVVVWASAFGLYGEHWMLLGVTVGIALVGVVLWGTIAGSMLPFVMKRLGADPAVSSAPFVATLVDVTGLVIYFSVASVVLAGTML
ncbi:magnesium transporter [Kangiella spongicola]|uniref:Magnesium transporter MgtE n=1 Tax=Kangiella spongicola TaxID=796379 RepID=A0A318D4T8_9GAMM|nr:magnesium transporter [Kangiella spongicola]PXF64270.1 magnesium transporter [Kangiella spongicola]